MTLEELDTDTFNDTITTTTNETLTVNTSRADKVIVTIDDGTTGNKAGQYTMTQRVHHDEISDYQFYDEVTGEQSRSWTDPAWGDKMEYEFNNTSGTDSNYRIVLKSYRELE